MTEVFLVGSPCFIFAKCIFLNCSWNLSQSLGPNWISFSTRTLYLSSCLLLLIGLIHHITVVNVFSFIYKLTVFLTSRNVTFFPYILMPLFPLIFGIHCKILRIQEVPPGRVSIWRHLGGLLLIALGLLGHTFHMSDVLCDSPCGGHIFKI